MSRGTLTDSPPVGSADLDLRIGHSYASPPALHAHVTSLARMEHRVAVVVKDDLDIPVAGDCGAEVLMQRGYCVIVPAQEGIEIVRQPTTAAEEHRGRFHLRELLCDRGRPVSEFVEILWSIKGARELVKHDARPDGIAPHLGYAVPSAYDPEQRAKRGPGTVGVIAAVDGLA